MAFNQTSKMRSELAGMAPGKPLGGRLVVFCSYMRALSLDLGREGERRRKNGLLAAVGVVGGDIQSSLLADLHVDNTLVPAANDATDTDGSAEVALSDGGVEAGDRQLS